MILPKSKLKPYIKLVCNFIFVFMVISPIVSFFSNNMSLEDTILKKITDYSKEYVDSYNDLANKTNNQSFSKGYEDGLKSVLQLKLDEYGYKLENLEMNGSNIETIKIKEKNKSKKDKNQDTEVFKNKSELNLKKDELKKDLIKVLDVSIQDIEID